MGWPSRILYVVPATGDTNGHLSHPGGQRWFWGEVHSDLWPIPDGKQMRTLQTSTVMENTLHPSSEGFSNYVCKKKRFYISEMVKMMKTPTKLFVYSYLSKYSKCVWCPQYMYISMYYFMWIKILKDNFHILCNEWKILNILTLFLNRK